MTTSALIDALLTHWEEIPATTAEQATMRARILALAQEIVQEIWDYAEWEFRHRSGTLTLPSGAYVVDGPTDFQTTGQSGGLFVDSQRTEIRWMDPLHLHRERELRAVQNNTVPKFYSIDNTGTTSGYARFVFDITASGSVTINIYYLATPPVLVDTTGSTNGLDKIPTEYHQSVVIPGCRWLIALSSGDGRTAELLVIYQHALARMKSRRRPGQESLERIGQYGRGITRYGAW